MLNPHTSSFLASLEYSGSGQYSHRGMPTPLTPARGISGFDLSSAGCCAMTAKPTDRKSGASLGAAASGMKKIMFSSASLRMSHG
jgi:hypothetical protein